MGTISTFEEIDAWKSARELTFRVYHLGRRQPFVRDFGLRDQIQRAAVSAMSNIAEGYESPTLKMFIRHLGIAKASAGEVRSQLYVAFDQAYVSQEEFEQLIDLSKKVAGQIARFMSYLKSPPPKQ